MSNSREEMREAQKRLDVERVWALKAVALCGPLKLKTHERSAPSLLGRSLKAIFTKSATKLASRGLGALSLCSR
jgi:hypothetical protein